MKKTVCIVLAILMLSCGCSGKGKSKNTTSPNSSLRRLAGMDKPENTLFYVINEPNGAMEKYLKNAVSVEIGGEDSAFFLTQNCDAVMTVFETIYDETSQSITQGTVYYSGSDEVVALRAMRSQGIPNCAVKVVEGEKSATYYFTENLKDGNPSIEYVIAE